MTLSIHFSALIFFLGVNLLLPVQIFSRRFPPPPSKNKKNRSSLNIDLVVHGERGLKHAYDVV